MRYIYLFLLLFSQLYGIVNTEVYRNSSNNSEKHKLNLGFSISDGNTNQSQFTLSHRYDFKRSDIDGFTVSSLQQSQVNGSKNKENIFMHLRISKSFSSNTLYESFFQYENDAFRNISARYLLGFGRRLSLTENVFLGVGAMLENETFTDKQSVTKARSTNYVSFISKINDYLKLKGTIYYQPLFSDFSNYRVSTQVNKSIKISQEISLVNTFQYKYYSHLPESVNGSDLFFSSSITLHY